MQAWCATSQRPALCRLVHSSTLLSIEHHTVNEVSRRASLSFDCTSAQHLHVVCLQGMARAKAAGFVNWRRNPSSFDAEAYLHYEQVRFPSWLLSSSSSYTFCCPCRAGPRLLMLLSPSPCHVTSPLSVLLSPSLLLFLSQLLSMNFTSNTKSRR